MNIDIELIDESKALSLDKSSFVNHQLGKEELLSDYILSLATICCPMTEMKLINQLNWSLGALFDEAEIVKMYDQHIQHQNLIVRPDKKTRDIYVSPLRYIANQKRYILLGVGPADHSLGNMILNETLKRTGHLRYWDVSDFESEEELMSLLKKSYIQPFSSDEWLKIDPEISEAYDSGSENFLSRLNDKLASKPLNERAFENCEYLDSSSSPKYFKGRWKDISQSDGEKRCIIRYQSEYSKLYLYGELNDKKVVRYIAFSVIWNRSLKDERSIAWMIQQAIDYSLEPQIYSLRRLDEEHTEIKFFHPIPNWIDRKILILGEPMLRKEGDHHLFSYKVENSMLELITHDLNRFWIKNDSKND